MARRFLCRTATLLGLLAVAQLLHWGTAAPLAEVTAGTATLDELIGLTAALAGWAVLGWTVLVLASTASAALPGAAGRLADGLAQRSVPAAARHAVRVALGLAVVAGPAGALPAAAVDGWPETAIRSMPGVGRPALVVAAPVPPPETRTASTPAAPSTVAVQQGDCLWRIAARALPPDATNAEIAAEWPRWYAANRAVVGDNPDLIIAGMVLRRPAAH